MIRSRCLILLGLALAGTVGVASAGDFDPFDVQDTVSRFPSKDLIKLDGIQDPCRFQEITAPLDLLEVVDRSLCNHPQTRQAWANVKAQAAQVGINQAAYLPSANVTAHVSEGPIRTMVTGYPQLSDDLHTTTRDETLNMNWTLFDFGLRRANLENARYLLAAANATQDATLQTVFASAAQAFYDLLSAEGAANAGMESEKSAQQSFMAANEKYQVGVGTLSDKLQAQTTFAQATLNRVTAEGEWRNARGMLAVAMGLPANTAFSIDSSQSTLPDTHFVRSVDVLIEDAKRNHPNLIAAKAQLQAAQASVKAAIAEGLPSVGLTANVDYNDQLGQLPDGINLPPANNYTRNKSISLQVNIPIFEGFSRSYRVQSAKVQVEIKKADLINSENQVSLEVWTSYQSLNTATENLKSTEDLMRSATQSFDVAQGRYKSGVGTIIELLSAQSALASARQERIKALSNWRVARLKLAASLGKLNFLAIQ